MSLGVAWEMMVPQHEFTACRPLNTLCISEMFPTPSSNRQLHLARITIPNADKTIHNDNSQTMHHLNVQDLRASI